MLSFVPYYGPPQFSSTRSSRPARPKLTSKNVIQIVVGLVVSLALIVGVLIAGAMYIARNLESVSQSDYSATRYDESGSYYAPDPASLALRSRIDELIPESAPVYSQQDIDAWLPEIVSLVEATAGKKFKHVPPVRLIGRAELRRILLAGIESSGEVLDGLPGEAEMTVVMVLGLYEPDSDVIYMLPGNVTPLMNLSGESTEFLEPMSKLVLAHELAHALQDQHLNLTKMQDAIGNVEQGHAFRATVEGHATLIEEAVANRMGLQLVRADKSDTPPPPTVISADDELLQAMFEYDELLNQLYYLKGCDFFEHNLRRGGQNQVWRILADPPKDTAAFIDPARYWQPGKGVAGADALLENLAGYFGDGTCSEERFALGAFTLRLMYRKLGPKEADTFVAAVQSASALELAHGSGDAVASVALFNLRGSADANAFVKSLERVPPGLLTESHDADKISLHIAGSGKLGGFDQLVAREIKYQGSLSSGRSGQGRVIRIARANQILEITDFGAGLTDQRCAELAKEIFRRVDQARAGGDAKAR